MLDENIRNLETVLRQGLVHIEEALLRAELNSQDMCCINSVSAAKALIQEFLWTYMPSGDDCHFFDRSCTANCGWSPMSSIFPVIEVQSDKVEHKQENHRSELGYTGFLQSANMLCVAKRSAELLHCNMCNVNCNSRSQWKQHVKGRQHQTKVGEDKLQRMKLTYLSKRNNDFFLKRVQRESNFCSTNNDIAKSNSPNGRRLKMKEAEFLRRWIYGKQKNGTLMCCELCNVTGNGKMQYIGHIKGNRHQMAVEQGANFCY